MNCLDRSSFTTRISCDLVIQLLNEVIIGEAGGLGRQDLIDNVMQVKLLNLHMIADLEDLITPSNFAEHISTRRVKKWIAILTNDVMAYLWVRVAFRVLADHLSDVKHRLLDRAIFE